MSEEKTYLIVNPKGIMHVVSEDHARSRLNSVGWRLATPEEKQAYFAAKGNQRFDKPLAAKFTPEPLADQALSEADAMPTQKAAQTEPGETAEAPEAEKPKPAKAKKAAQPTDQASE